MLLYFDHGSATTKSSAGYSEAKHHPVEGPGSRIQNEVKQCNEVNNRGPLVQEKIVANGLKNTCDNASDKELQTFIKSALLPIDTVKDQVTNLKCCYLSRQKLYKCEIPIPQITLKSKILCKNLTSHIPSSIPRSPRRSLRMTPLAALVLPLAILTTVTATKPPSASPTTQHQLTTEQQAHLRRERALAASEWSPLVFLHPNERYFPSDVHSFLKHVVPREVPDSDHTPPPPLLLPMSRSLDTRALPEGDAGEHTYLIAPMEPKCKNCPLSDFLYGTKPSISYSPAVYAVITSCLPQAKKRAFARKASRRQARRRRFRFRKRGTPRFRGRRKTPPQASYNENYNANPSFAPPSNRFDSDYFTRRRDSRGFVLLDEEEFSTNIPHQPPLLPPSTTLLPPKTRLVPPSTVTFTSDEPSSFLVSEFGSADINLDISDVVYLQLDGSGSGAPPTSVQQNFTYSDGSGTFPDNFPSAAVYHESLASQNSILPQKDKDKLTGHKFTVTYWMFYPFSQGKEVCTSRLWLLGRVFKPRIRNKCFGEEVTLNSHVGDWEHVSIYFEDSQPKRMYVSTHTYGSYYDYKPSDNVFVYRGKDTRIGLPLSPKYPPIIKMDGTHPVLYGALGSHGLWGSPGVHRYENLLPLDDMTGAGTPWRTWRNIDLIDSRDPDKDRPDRQWLQFHGRWGNPAKDCHKALFGSCDLSNGPTGIPLKRDNFPCHDPLDATFFPED